mmetsp:Transcript_12007/g.28717  ORF Transcript_12007/g.28717 Transcript_12007/m.28717 type:complete len:179 (+) Transcript_12007:102-638(+)
MTSSYKQKKNWIVRQSNANDKEAVEALLRLCYTNLLSNDYEEELLQTALPLLCCARQELLTSATWYVVEDADTRTIVGCGGWTPKSPLGEAIPHLRHFATDPKQLRKGVARAIWDRTWEDWCKASRDSKEVPQMEVFSTITAESFYASLGFEKVRDITIPIRDDCQFPAVLMRRPHIG